jgi:hypothetical protein
MQQRHLRWLMIMTGLPNLAVAHRRSCTGAAGADAGIAVCVLSWTEHMCSAFLKLRRCFSPGSQQTGLSRTQSGKPHASH